MSIILQMQMCSVSDRDETVRVCKDDDFAGFDILMWIDES
jgi:hypothetical protein